MCLCRCLNANRRLSTQLAVENDIVTPFSSMIVLINQQQQQNRLDELENQDDRFDCELEGVGETDENMLVTAVAERRFTTLA